MKILIFTVIFLILLSLFSTSQNSAFSQYDTKDYPVKSNTFVKKVMKMSSTAFQNNNSIPKKYTCDGENLSPPLKISDIPKKTKSIALIVDDPDATIGTFTHWVIWGISPKKSQFGEGEKKGFSEGITGFGKTGYSGPCPPSGTHRYFFKLYALDSAIDISTKSNKQDLLASIQNHVIQTATLIGKYSR